MTDFIAIVAQNAALITIVGVAWVAISFPAAMLLGRWIKNGGLGSVDELEGKEDEE